MNAHDHEPSGPGSTGAGGSVEPRAPEPAPTAHVPPPGAGLMNVLRWVLFAGLLVLAAISVGSYLLSRSGRGVAATKQQARYYCPMHPSYTSDRPGECPICGMTLELIPHDGHEAHGAAAGAGDVPGLTSVQISPERIQLIGVRTARVVRAELGDRLDLVGFVTPDEALLRRVQIKAAGWVQQLLVNRTGEQVSVGQPLVAIQSPELFQAEQEFLIELGASRSAPGDRHESGGQPASLQRLRLLGVPEEEIVRLGNERVANPVITLRSTVNGTVLERGVSEGQYVSADTPLFTVADLGRVWVLADLYEMNFTRVRVGDRARFTADALPQRSFDGTVEFIYPTVSSETRTIKARLAFDNPDGSLRPGMYGRVEVRGRGEPALVVPAEAVVNTGQSTYVFLAHAGGRFEPRLVQTGREDGERVQIVRGVAPGDTVVQSASFLIDSESRLKAAIAGMGQAGPAAGAPPVPGHAH